ncbi:MAG: hypothetical protein QXF88_00605 [Candidatus Aenigmatarchaeota archaeon]
MRKLILLLLIPAVLAQDIDLRHIGFGDTQAAILLSLTNTGNEVINDPDVYVDGEYYQQLSISIKPGTTITFYVFADSGEHKIDVSYKGKNYTVDVINTIVESEPAYEEKQPINRWFLFALVLIPFFITIYLLVKRPKLV